MPGEKGKTEEPVLPSFLLPSYTHSPWGGRAQLNSPTDPHCVGTLVSLKDLVVAASETMELTFFHTHWPEEGGKEGGREKQCCAIFIPTQKHKHLTSY